MVKALSHIQTKVNKTNQSNPPFNMFYSNEKTRHDLAQVSLKCIQFIQQASIIVRKDELKLLKGN